MPNGDLYCCHNNIGVRYVQIQLSKNIDHKKQIFQSVFPQVLSKNKLKFYREHTTSCIYLIIL